MIIDTIAGYCGYGMFYKHHECGIHLSYPIKKSEGGETMIGWRRSFIHGLISIVFIFITALGFATAKKVGDDVNSTSWQSYSNSESNFTFEYPQGWEIADDFYYKTHWSVTLQKIGGSEDSDNWIRINSPQFQVEDGVCILVGNEAICTYSRNADVLEILKRVADSFKLKDVQQGKNIQ